MKKILRLFVLTMLLVAPSCVMAQSQMRLQLANGQSAVYVLADSPVVGFADSKLVVTVKGESTQFELSEVQKFTFEAVSTGISQAAAEGTLRFDYSDGRTLRVSGASVNKAMLFDAAGRVVTTASVQDGQAEIGVSTLPAGVYVLKVGSQSLKITRK